MGIISILIAFVFGFLVRMVGLPPLVGFIAAGFILNFLGVESNEMIQNASDVGILLLLFTIGLKLDLRSIFRKHIWMGGSIHMSIIVIVFGLILLLLHVAGFPFFEEIDFGIAVLLSFALSFSSTVFAVKVLEEKGDMKSLQAKTAIGILIIQDLLAVLFISSTKGQMPSPWALLLLGFPFLRPFLIWLMKKSGHGEILILYGFLLALLGAEIFDLVGLKPDLGALITGVIIANHPRSEELSKTLLGFKDFFLIAFFLSIGLTGDPHWWMAGAALIFTFLIPLKTFMYFWVLTWFRLRSRTSFITSLNLSNYSEFGLIVSSIAAVQGWLSNDWLLVFALTISFSFILSSYLNNHIYYSKFESFLSVFERKQRLKDDQEIKTDHARILIFGMGTIGTGAYDYLVEKYGSKILGLDANYEVVQQQQHEGRNVILGDVTDSGFWEKLKPGNISLVMLAIPNHSANKYAASRLQSCHFYGRIAAIAHFEDEIKDLENLQVHSVFNLYEEAGSGFAHHVCSQIRDID